MTQEIPISSDAAHLVYAYEIASMSSDPSTQTGAVLRCGSAWPVGTCNHMPKGVNDDPSMSRADKYRLVVHAEEGAILAAARHGLTTRGSTLYAPWAACGNCAKAIIEAGVERVVVHGPMMDATPERWREEVAFGLNLLHGAGVVVDRVEGPLMAAPKIRFDGKTWSPKDAH